MRQIISGINKKDRQSLLQVSCGVINIFMANLYLGELLSFEQPCSMSGEMTTKNVFLE